MVVFPIAGGPEMITDFINFIRSWRSWLVS
jgi:hypothetical protein